MAGVEPSDGATYSLDELQKFVGGYVQAVPIGATKVLLCNEDGIALGLALNQIASARYGGHVIGARLLGDVLVCESKFLR